MKTRLASRTRSTTSSVTSTAVPPPPDNLAYACVVCNRHKGSDVASIDPGEGRPPGWIFHCEVAIYPEPGSIVESGKRLLRPAVLVPGLKISVKLTERDVVSTQIPQCLGAYKHRSQNSLIEWS